MEPILAVFQFQLIPPDKNVNGSKGDMGVEKCATLDVSAWYISTVFHLELLDGILPSRRDDSTAVILSCPRGRLFWTRLLLKST